ncbi:hypothetical protein PTKIN_Ptkin16aG0091000 [Pterospermum kingtungense]
MNIPNLHFLSSSVFLILSIHWFMVNYAMTVRNLTTDQHALLQFKYQISDPHNVLAYNWTTTTSVCYWIGISCAAKHGRVIALNLPSMDLDGAIPPYLGNLSFLVSFNLSHNSFHGHLPAELERLSRLKLFDLSFNFISGEIPSWFVMLNKILYLNLRNNNFTGKIPRSMGNLTRLKILAMGENSLEGKFFPLKFFDQLLI